MALLKEITNSFTNLINGFERGRVRVRHGVSEATINILARKSVNIMSHVTGSAPGEIVQLDPRGVLVPGH